MDSVIFEDPSKPRPSARRARPGPPTEKPLVQRAMPSSTVHETGLPAEGRLDAGGPECDFSRGVEEASLEQLFDLGALDEGGIDDLDSLFNSSEPTLNELGSGSSGFNSPGGPVPYPAGCLYDSPLIEPNRDQVTEYDVRPPRLPDGDDERALALPSGGGDGEEEAAEDIDDTDTLESRRCDLVTQFRGTKRPRSDTGATTSASLGVTGAWPPTVDPHGRLDLPPSPGPRIRVEVPAQSHEPRTTNASTFAPGRPSHTRENVQTPTTQVPRSRTVGRRQRQQRSVAEFADESIRSEHRPRGSPPTPPHTTGGSPRRLKSLIPSDESEEEREFAEHTASQHTPRRPRTGPRGAWAPSQKRQRRGSWGSAAARRATNVLSRSSEHDGANTLSFGEVDDVSPGHSAGRPTCLHIQPVRSTDAAVFTALVGSPDEITSLLASPRAWGVGAGTPYTAPLTDINLRRHPSLGCWLLTATAPRAARRPGAAEIDDPGTPRSTGGGGGRVGANPHAKAQRADDDSDISVYCPSEAESGHRGVLRGQWTSEEDDSLLKWVREGRPWPWIYKRFPLRTHNAVSSHWHVTLRKGRGRRRLR